MKTELELAKSILSRETYFIVEELFYRHKNNEAALIKELQKLFYKPIEPKEKQQTLL